MIQKPTLSVKRKLTVPNKVKGRLEGMFSFQSWTTKMSSKLLLSITHINSPTVHLIHSSVTNSLPTYTLSLYFWACHQPSSQPFYTDYSPFPKTKPPSDHLGSVPSLLTSFRTFWRLWKILAKSDYPCSMNHLKVTTEFLHSFPLSMPFNILFVKDTSEKRSLV